MANKTLVKRIEEVLHQEISMADLAARVERVMNAEIPGTPRLTGRRLGSRVMYVALPGRGKAKTNLSVRAAQVMKFLERNTRATSKSLQVALRVNRNVIAGAVHELKQAGVIRTEEYNVPGRHRMVEAVHEYRPRKKRR